jgi:GT2 family glycosyltransferase
MSSKVQNLPWIVVHHNSEEYLRESISSLLAQGLIPELGIIVDNSENVQIKSSLEITYPNIRKIYVANKGYANAVNTGLDEIRQTNHQYEYALVATHDVKPEKNCIDVLLSEISSDKSIGAVGPLLLGGSFEENQIWSAGGELHSRYKIAKHLMAKEYLVGDSNMERVKYCDWLDGCLCVYRLDAVRNLRMNEIFFLYFEETDFHQRIQSEGFKIANVRKARSFQSTQGTPSFWFGRNLLIFNEFNLKSIDSFISSALQLIIHFLRLVKNRDLRKGAVPLIKGIAEGRRVIATIKRNRNGA